MEDRLPYLMFQEQLAFQRLQRLKEELEIMRMKNREYEIQNLIYELFNGTKSLDSFADVSIEDSLDSEWYLNRVSKAISMKMREMAAGGSTNGNEGMQELNAVKKPAVKDN
ncbi:hypothetical protein AQUCO_01600029v1 [Aquilegia coerulea]|uniref:Uncharacterized protein n=1 Tax=Aquilegia coerulea TaxID=218851 RepID=A0A2G5DPV5_AQUCA|nr:hypothetical protein AQUCO_01600029v1 [Aquilegia coerulea]